MSTEEITEVLERVQNWPTSMRVALARQILDTVQQTPKETLPRGPSAAEVAAMFQTAKPAPDDGTVDQWIGEHLTKKYGS